MTTHFPAHKTVTELRAELAEVRSDRQREHELRVRYAGVTEIQADRIRRLEAENARLNMEMAAYRERLTPKDVEAMTAVIAALTAEKATRAAPTPYTGSITDSIDGPQPDLREVSTLCAVCDQIKELHPNTHPWTARVTLETGAKHEQG